MKTAKLIAPEMPAAKPVKAKATPLRGDIFTRAGNAFSDFIERRIRW
jgi:hypothetical protein